jgi:hypothetical protein
MHIEWPPVVVGLGVVAAGILLFRFRAQFARNTSAMQRSMYGKLGEVVAKSNTPRMVGGVAIGWMALGALIVLLGLFYL